MQTESYDSVRELARLNAEIAATSEHLTLPDLNESINSVNVDFAITRLDGRALTNAIAAEYKKAAQEFAASAARTNALRTIQTLTDMLSSIAAQVAAMNESASQTGFSYATAYNYSLSGNMYTRHRTVDMGMTSTQEVWAYQAYTFSTDMIFTDAERESIMTLLDDEANARELETRIKFYASILPLRLQGLNIDKYIGNFPKYNDKGKRESDGEGEFGRIGRDIGDNDADVQKYNQEVFMGARVAASVLGFIPVVGTAVSIGANTWLSAVQTMETGGSWKQFATTTSNIRSLQQAQED